MSGIGDYIHYRRSRYQEYGITQNTKGGGVSYSSALASNRQYLLSLIKSKSVSEAQCARLSEYFSNFYYNKTGQLTSAIQIQNDQGEVVTMGVQNLIAEAVRQYSSVDTAKYVDGAMVQKVLQNTTSKLANTVHSTGIASITGATFAKYWASINQMVKNVSKAFQRNERFADFSQLFKTEQDLQRAVSDLQNNMNNVLSKLPPLNTLQTSYKRIALDDKNDFGNSLRSIIDQYNQLIKWYQGSFGGLLAGDTHEIATSMVQIIDTMGSDLSQFTVQSLTDLLLQNFVTGKNSAVNTLSTNNGIDINLLPYVEEALDKQKQKGHTSFASGKTDAGTFSIEYTSADGINPYGTIDVVLNPDSDAALAQKLGVNNINASLKNYSDVTASYAGHTGISIVSEVPMDMLLGILNTDFINHYLNLLGAYPTSQGGDDFSAGYEQFLWAAAIRGLMGADTSNPNDVLIINNRQTQQVYVIPTSFLKNEITFRDYIDVHVHPEIYPDYNKWNRWQGDRIPSQENAQRRIINFIVQLHSYKFKVYLNAAGIKNFI